MLDHVLRAFDLLIKSGELGAADCRNLNLLTQHLDPQGETDREAMIELLFAGSKDPDGACRSFLSRLKAGAAQAADEAERSGNANAAAVFRSITVARIKAKGGAARLKFSAQAPKELPQVTGRVNREYLPEEYQPSTGCKPEDLPQLQREELSRRQEKAEEKPLCSHLGCSRLAEYCCDEFEPTIGNRHNVRTSGKRTLTEAAIEVLAARFKKKNKDNEEEKTSYETLADLFDWLENSETSLYALLGDYGMGKTFTCRVFAQQLAERCATNPNLPRPVYLDLRDVPTFVRDGNITRQPTLEEMLQEVLRLAEKGADYSAEELIEAARQGLLLLIFDGLDEKLVYYTNDMRSQFLNELLRVFPQDGRARVKIVISCRTHHFETISQMDSFLLGLNRSGVQGEDYRALHLLPFSSSQILRLLTRLLGSGDANRVFSFIDSEAYLKDLAQRPFMLRQLSRTLPDLQQMKSQGLPVNAASFYQALIADSISRDDEKHILKPRHKQQLLTDLAAAFWQGATQVWQIDRLNDWFCAWLEARPALAAQYRDEDWQVLEKDLRNSTLLVRFGEQDFGFSHSSMQEFFLSKWLLRQWQEDEDFRMEQALSSLTRQFVFDSLALLTEQELARINKGLAATLARPWSDMSELALDIIAELARQKKAAPELGDVDLRRSFLSNRQIRGLRGQTLLLDQAEAHASQWLDCHFQQIDIGQGNISGSLWRDCSWQECNPVGASPCACPGPEDAGNTAGRLSLQDRITLANCQGTTSLPQPHCFPPVARQAAEPFNLADWRQGHNNPRVWSCCFSPDGSYILSAGDDYTLKLWKATDTGHCVSTFKGYEEASQRTPSSDNNNIWDVQPEQNNLSVFIRPLSASSIPKDGLILCCCFSPDGNYILSAADDDTPLALGDNTLKLWDLTGRCISTFKGHEWYIQSCCFSPDGSRILSSSWDNTLKLWDLTGHCISTFKDHEDYVLNCSFRADGSRILSASDDNTLKLWDMAGHCLLTFQGHEGGVQSCCFSPDGSRILSASDDNTLKLWDMAGHCLLTFQGHEGRVRSCAFSPDGQCVLSASFDGTLRLWRLDGTLERIFAAERGQWYAAFFSSNQLEKIIGTELSWKMANFAKDGKTWTLDETGCFEWVPAQY
ncbi:NACHT domain-containing protein [Candidatus Electronema sp. JC]|uniref:NACHT and WD40 repeat domain-containing protein n=1 Tax=Candidatus Electronema sp. JC TaxID=3401570 RepID=UPI003B430E48